MIVLTTIKKKAASAIAAVGVAAAMALGGTFAWQSISQTALNEASDVVNPGGRLHDDFDGTNKDVYVENFADEPIFARIRLAEYFEIVMNKGTGAEKSVSILGSKTANTDASGTADGTYTYSYETFEGYSSLKDGVVSAGVDAKGDGKPSYWSWKTGGSTVYMPTFNKNKDSLAADLNGEYVGAVGGISDRDGTQYTGYVDWSTWKGENNMTGVGATKSGTEIYDADANDADEVGTDFDNLSKYEAAGNVVTVSVDADGKPISHAAAQTSFGKLMSMGDWLDMVEEADSGYDPSVHGSYWVYDEDGWVYWSSPIEPGTATGLLLDGIELNQVMDDTWYYAIDVTAQFITADDLGEPGEEGEDGEAVAGTGFYADGLSDEALALLAAIGVDVGDYDEGREEPYITYILVPGGEGKQDVYKEETTVFQGDSLYIEVFDEDGSPISWEGVDVYVDNEEGTQNSYQYSTEGIETYSDWEGKRAITPQAKILIPEDAPVGDVILYIELPGEDGALYYVYVTVLESEGDAGAAPTFVVNDTTNTAVLGSDLSSGAEVEAYPGTQISVTSTNAALTWEAKGHRSYKSVSAGTPNLDDEGRSVYTFNIGADEPIGTKITFTQTSEDGEVYTLSVVVADEPRNYTATVYLLSKFGTSSAYESIEGGVATVARGDKFYISLADSNGEPIDISAATVNTEGFGISFTGIQTLGLLFKPTVTTTPQAMISVSADVERGLSTLEIEAGGTKYEIDLAVMQNCELYLGAGDGRFPTSGMYIVEGKTYSFNAHKTQVVDQTSWLGSAKAEYEDGTPLEIVGGEDYTKTIAIEPGHSELTVTWKHDEGDGREYVSTFPIVRAL